MKCTHPHRTRDCRKLLNHTDPDRMDQIARELEICYNCGDPGHTARSCKEQKPKCARCKNGNTHLTIFHHFLARRNQRNQERAEAKGQGQKGGAPRQTNTSAVQRQQGQTEATRTMKVAATEIDLTQTTPVVPNGGETEPVIDQPSH